MEKGVRNEDNSNRPEQTCIRLAPPGKLNMAGSTLLCRKTRDSSVPSREVITTELI